MQIGGSLGTVKSVRRELGLRCVQRLRALCAQEDVVVLEIISDARGVFIPLHPSLQL
jgi:hypothetical protein